MRNLEAQEQIKLIHWCELYKNKHPELASIYAIPNGGSRDIREAANLKKQGVKPGMPDLCLPVARCGYNSLYIELKAGKNKTTKNQKNKIKELTGWGNKAAVCYGFDEAIDIVLRYLRG